MERKDPYDTSMYAAPVRRTVADAIKADLLRYYDPIHGVGTPPGAPERPASPASTSRSADRTPVDCIYGTSGPPKPKPPGIVRDESSGGGGLDALRAVSDHPGVKIARAISNHPGAEPLWAAWRLGLKDLQTFVLTPFPDSTPPREEPGSIGTPAPDSWTGQAREAGMERGR